MVCRDTSSRGQGDFVREMFDICPWLVNDINPL
ncbi:MAG: hypothetical protein JWQ71_546 [Pedosphaera sp.]|nr:hypothetical protein [Pedosphaera sp.]